ncbi:DUF6886 family protein [Saccharothrix coeruleofusca]|uniref:Uncharacterized protein n=1 Tax=Saccharothrix coeruleofusca TaxID=33919 RepID=A0A918EDZ4_9PSEU|nr:DUF6886 family protein [Saccharothrix coeruleofusca]MBP2336349.1 hypothetical protein [Saccharothrix coeruleofusca]GGP53774.1 hypothetical protein GCM10010185_27540 [Saccharothrix coeruleofusca]
MRPAAGEVLHFSEDSTITRFVPHVAATAKVPGAYVWAVDGARAPDYWFPRQCPRAMAWVEPTTTEADRAWLGAGRVHVVEYRWLPALLSARLYAYRFDASAFRPIGDPPHAHVATGPVVPLGPPQPVGDLVRLHGQAGVELRLTTSLWPFWDRVTASTLGFSGIRLRNAVSRPEPG